MSGHRTRDPNRPDSTADTRKRDGAEVDQEEKETPQGAEMDEDQQQNEGDQITEDARRYINAEEAAQEVRRSGRKAKGDSIP